jgi:predicted acylesterase/phospholipase RssA
LLTLQGGGALGAFEVGVLEHLHDHLDVSRQISAISGVSFGAINAAIYIANLHDDPIRALKEFYNELTLIDSPLYECLKFGLSKDTPFEGVLTDQSLPASLLSTLMLNSPVFRLRTDLYKCGFWTYFFDTRQLEPLLERFIDLERLNSKDSPQFVMTAVDIESGELVTFSTREVFITHAHIMASASLPLVMKPTLIDGKLYWDGGIFDNTPWLTLLQSLQRKDIWEATKPTVDRRATGGLERNRPTRKRWISVEVFPREGPAPTTIFHLPNRLIQMMGRAKITRRTRDTIYEYGTLANWLEAFFHELSEDESSKSLALEFAEEMLPEEYQPLEEKMPDPEDKEIEELRQKLKDDRIPSDDKKQALLQFITKNNMTFKFIEPYFHMKVISAARRALRAYFNELRPDPRLRNTDPAPADADGVTKTNHVARITELNYKGLSGSALGAIQEFASLSNTFRVSSDEELDAKKLADAFRGTELITNQIALFADIELLPVQSTLRSELLNMGDFSASTIRKLHQEGLRAAGEQVRVVEFRALPKPCEVEFMLDPLKDIGELPRLPKKNNQIIVARVHRKDDADAAEETTLHFRMFVNGQMVVDKSELEVEGYEREKREFKRRIYWLGVYRDFLQATAKYGPEFKEKKDKQAAKRFEDMTKKVERLSASEKKRFTAAVASMFACWRVQREIQYIPPGGTD